MTGVVLLTGATGFLGAQIARRLVSDTGLSLVALVRGDNLDVATRRLRREWWPWPELSKEIGGRVRVAVGDVTEERLGLSDEDYCYIVDNVTHVIHTAAELNLNGSLIEMRKVNVSGTSNVLELAKAIHNRHGLMRFSHVSTAYVSGGRSGLISEEDLTDEYGFSNTYELTKYEGEKLVQEAKALLPLSVFRPGIIVGDSKTGQIRTFNTIYYPLRLYLKGGLRVLPTGSSAKINMVPVDYVADSVVRLTLMREAEGLTFHLTPSHESLPTLGEFLGVVRSWVKANMRIDTHQVLFVPLPAPKPATRDRLTKTRSSEGLTGKLRDLRPYFSIKKQYSRDNVERLLGEYAFNWRESLPSLLSYAIYHGLLHPAPRTVHEQIFARLSGRSMPVSFKDVVEGRVVNRDNKQIQGDILSAVGALRSLGIAKGDKVAIVGLNSSRYLTLDVAIGLVGAVSVPLYYTSPVSEIRDIVSASGAKMLLVGAPKILEYLCETGLTVPVVSFCNEDFEESPMGCIGSSSPYSIGAGNDRYEDSPVEYGELATVRYTSGTTGHPKGVCFSHGSLRWIGEASCSLFPWKTRSKEITYLSFLPLNHVVEGIIGAYAPYYAPAPLNIYFLEEFSGLQKALSMVRPTVFFSVPRFYEKVWDGLLKSPVGRAYAKSRGVTRALLRPIVRYALLARAGLDRCSQLMAGSAQVSEGLLGEYRELGIEVHNAYGLTEAPLVAMNLVGRNKVGTVGEPLPQTIVKVDDDGEILVKGPQVTEGYLDPEEHPPFRDGFLATGDLGRFQDGYLVVDGRKKDLIKTSYGKYVQPSKIEAMLREIRDVEEAMVVGEGRPYCVALLWMKRGIDRAEALASTDQSVAVINKRLSHPEQLKRWAILENDLSMSKGELTGTMKLKRSVVMAHLSDLVESLYSGHSSRPLDHRTVGGTTLGELEAAPSVHLAS